MHGWTWLIIVGGAMTALLAIAASRAHLHRDRLRRLLRFVPDCLELLRGLARDPAVPRRAKIIAVVTVAYLALPIDLIPDFIPVIGYLDDVLLVAWAIRHLMTIVGRERVAAHWHGDPDAPTHPADRPSGLTASPHQHQLPHRSCHPLIRHPLDEAGARVLEEPAPPSRAPRPVTEHVIGLLVSRYEGENVGGQSNVSISHRMRASRPWDPATGAPSSTTAP